MDNDHDDDDNDDDDVEDDDDDEDQHSVGPHIGRVLSDYLKMMGI